MVTMVKVISINISKHKGISKTPLTSGIFRENEGLVGDAHAGPGPRQVSLIAKESIDKFNRNIKLKNLCAKNGIFGENLTTTGVALHKLKVGTRIKIGEVTLEISQIGKECHTHCAIFQKVGKCIMPSEGVFAKVIQGGAIKVDDSIIIMR